eukprot:GGOE01053855.1.p1 GENE.GGOE01053855.1~~GGOE01053855.1.p1  ORF type:complete len:211 (-),score=40.89 GGOE01053855.1:161-748(-)
MGNHLCCDEALADGPYRLEVAPVDVSGIPSGRAVRVRLEIDKNFSCSNVAQFSDDERRYVWPKEELIVFHGASLGTDEVRVSLLGVAQAADQQAPTEQVVLSRLGLRRDVVTSITILEHSYPLLLRLKLQPTHVTFGAESVCATAILSGTTGVSHSTCTGLSSDMLPSSPMYRSEASSEEGALQRLRLLSDVPST